MMDDEFLISMTLRVKVGKPMPWADLEIFDKLNVRTVGSALKKMGLLVEV